MTAQEIQACVSIGALVDEYRRREKQEHIQQLIVVRYNELVEAAKAAARLEGR